MSARDFTPHDYQGQIICHQLEVERGATWAGMGMGKTVSTLTVLDGLQFIDSAPALVLAPKRVAESTWPDEAVKWSHLRNTSVVAIIGTEQQRRAALRQTASIYTTNYENVPWLVEHLAGEWPFGTVVSDESTRLKSFRTRQGGMRARALASVAFRSHRFIELTGTPSPNGLQDLWGQAYFLDRGAALGRSFEAFKQRWFSVVTVGDSRAAQQLTPLPHAQTEIQDRLRHLCITLDPADWFDLQVPIVRPVYVELPAKARKLYRDMEREMFLSINGSDVEAFNAAAKTMKCLQLANGAIYTNEAATEWAEVHDAKLDALESIINEAAGMPVLVAYHFKSDLARILKAFPQARALDDNPATIRQWNAGKIPVLCAHPASAGHGLNLQDGGNILAYFSHDWNLENRMQILERIGPMRQHQSGHKRPVWVYNIIARDTVDDLVIARVESKRGVQEILLEAMKRRTVT